MIDDDTKDDIRKRLSDAKSKLGVLDSMAVARQYEGPQDELQRFICSEGRKIGVRMVGCE
jgi:hypothetical protein